MPRPLDQRLKSRRQVAAPQPAVGADPPRWLGLAATALVAVFALALAVVVLGPHRVGDYYTETDFYGGYVEGARLFLRGAPDPSRYGVSGPFFDAALAAVSLVARDLFHAGELISILSAVAVLALWYRLLRVRAGTWVAAWAVAFLATNAVLFRYGYSATTDALALALGSAALHTGLARRGRATPLLAGLYAGLATLTRYSAVAVLPALAVAAWTGRERHGRSRGAALALVVAGFGAMVAPFTAWMLQHGQVPGGLLFHNVAYDVYATGAGRTLADYQVQTQPGMTSLGGAIARDPAAFVAREAANLVGHLRGDATELLGWPLAALAALGALRLLVARRGRAADTLAFAGLCAYLALVPAPASARYSLAVLPFYAALAAAALVPWGRGAGAWRVWAPAALGIASLGFGLTQNVRAQREEFALLPLETRDAARALREAPVDTRRVMAVKPHIAYLANARFAPMPNGLPLAELARACARDSVGWLYYSWIEASNRPEYWYLLDPGARVPGLRPVVDVSRLPAVLYRIEPGFGAEPEWLANDSLRVSHEVTFLRRLPPRIRWRGELSLAVWAGTHDAWADCERHTRALVAADPSSAFAWRLLGEALARRDDRAGGLQAFERAVALAPNDAEARVGLGFMRLANGDVAGAAEAWRPAIGATRNPEMLKRMAMIFRRFGDESSAARAEAAARNLP
jgi:tetratricopeptide (TPR) repeat protein